MSVPRTDAHEPTDACADVHCYSHDVDEPGTGYIICGECGHLYRTKRDLRRAYRREVGALTLSEWRALPRWRKAFRLGYAASWLFPPRASRITFCQECAHDF